jgi:hypothetical protein
MMGLDYVSEPRPPTGQLFIPQVIDMSAWRAMTMLLGGKNSWLVHQSSLAVLQAETSRANRRNGRRSENFAYQYLKYLKGSLTCRKMLRHGTSGFISHPKEGVLLIFIAIKNPSPRSRLNPRPLGPVAITLTTTPQRRPKLVVGQIVKNFPAIYETRRFITVFNRARYWSLFRPHESMWDFRFSRRRVCRPLSGV